MFPFLPTWLNELLPILVLLVVVTLVLVFLPKVELGHSKAFLVRRVWNWLPLGLTYSFLYMGRYNLATAKNDLGALMNNEAFGTIKATGTIVYGLSFLLNGPLADRLGGRTTMLIAAAGSAACNAAMGLVLASGERTHLVSYLTVLYAVNMYFQSFGAVSVVKVNAAWFHLRERGSFGGIFGILISLGIYFAYDWTARIVNGPDKGGFDLPTQWTFFVPAMILVVFFVLDYFLVRDTPAQAGLKDIETGDASWGDDAPPGGFTETVRRVGKVARAMLSNPVILVIAGIEFCSGFLRASLMDWYYLLAKQAHFMDRFVPHNWGMVQCVAGILGGIVAGLISDRVFHARRGPVAAVLYGVMVVGAVLVYFTIRTPWLDVVVAVMMLAIIGVHGMLSGAASMDFGGKNNVGLAVGIIDGLVYLGQGTQAIILGQLLPDERTPAAAHPENWVAWPMAMVPIALLGLALSARVWNARPTGKAAAH